MNTTITKGQIARERVLWRQLTPEEKSKLEKNIRLESRNVAQSWSSQPVLKVFANAPFFKDLPKATIAALHQLTGSREAVHYIMSAAMLTTTSKLMPEDIIKFDGNDMWIPSQEMVDGLVAVYNELGIRLDTEFIGDWATVGVLSSANAAGRPQIMNSAIPGVARVPVQAVGLQELSSSITPVSSDSLKTSVQMVCATPFLAAKSRFSTKGVLESLMDKAHKLAASMDQAGMTWNGDIIRRATALASSRLENGDYLDDYPVKDGAPGKFDHLIEAVEESAQTVVEVEGHAPAATEVNTERAVDETTESRFSKLRDLLRKRGKGKNDSSPAAARSDEPDVSSVDLTMKESSDTEECGDKYSAHAELRNGETVADALERKGAPEKVTDALKQFQPLIEALKNSTNPNTVCALVAFQPFVDDSPALVMVSANDHIISAKNALVASIKLLLSGNAPLKMTAEELAELKSEIREIVDEL